MKNIVTCVGKALIRYSIQYTRKIDTLITLAAGSEKFDRNVRVTLW